MTFSPKDKAFYLKVLQIVGPSALLLGWMVYWLTGGVSADTKDTNKILHEHVVTSTTGVATLEKIERRLTTMCVNDAVAIGANPTKCLE